MRSGGFVLALGACGHGAASTDSAPCQPGIVYLDRFGGSYDHGMVDDAGANLSVLFDGPRTLPAWPGDDTAWHDLTTCIRDALQPFAITVTETDPGTAKHVELVFTTSYWGPGGSGVGFIVPSDCRPGYQVEVVFGDAFVSPTRECEVAMGAFAEMTALVSPGANCLDFTSPATDCGVRFFVDSDIACVDQATGQPAACRCKPGATENTYRSIQALFPACGGD